MATKTHPAELHVICKSMELFIVSTVKLKYQMEVDFSKTTAKPRIIQFRIHNLTELIIVLFPSVYGPCFWLQGTAVIFVYHQNGENLAKSWSSVRRALESAHKFYSIGFYIDVSTFELSLIRF